MPRPGRPTTERAKNFKGTLRQLIRTMSHYKLPLAAAMLFAILSTIFNIAGPKVLAKATTALPPAGSPGCAAPAALILCISAASCCFCWGCTC